MNRWVIGKFDEWEDLSKTDGKFRLKSISQYQNWILGVVVIDPSKVQQNNTDNSMG